MSSDPQISANPSSPVIGNTITSGDNGSQVTQLNQPALVDETLQSQKSNNQLENADIEKGAPDDLQYKYLVKRFNFKVVLSTFACSLVVAYMAFVNNVARTLSRINYAHGIPFNICMLLGFLSISLHALSTIVSSRGAVLCSDPELIEEKKYKVEDFKDILSLCQHLNLHGIIVFALAVLGSSFFVFEDYIYPSVFCGFSFVLVFLIFVGKYRKLSLIHKDLMRIWDGVNAFWNRGK
ncbi:hypothetical protein M378DRAFT_15684 [Amanita muscaria Koide BX008]|uniref:Uncharacterized protein n=1 Tax=Amanita muscaria (strain Koide BX008) TaxID=946122 RepID=A0A0C2WAG7_AMAMK|nr:hypothetical protein M378DRAFT_15684 [Amanita muscaria Koide BX008]